MDNEEFKNRKANSGINEKYSTEKVGEDTIKQSSRNKFVIGASIVILILLLTPLVYFAQSKFVKPDSTVNPNLVTNTRSIPPDKKSDNKVSVNDHDKRVALSAAEHIKKSLQCQYAIDSKYPASLVQIDQSCVPPRDIKIPDIAKDLDSLNYTSTNDGRGFSFEIPVVPGEGYFITNEKTEYIVIPENIQSELMAKSRDETRKFDLHRMRQLIELNYINNYPANKFLCNDLSYPCYGNSQLPAATSVDGTGWIKINFNQQNINTTELPIDPVNNASHHYIYCADQSGWGIVTVFESDIYTKDMQNDGGIDDTKYEIGTNLELLSNTKDCKY